MATLVTEFPKTVGRPEKYPYAQWFDGQMWALEEGVDFTTSVDSLRGAINSAKKKRKIAVRTAAVTDPATGRHIVTIQKTGEAAKPVKAEKKAPAKKAAKKTTAKKTTSAKK